MWLLKLPCIIIILAYLIYRIFVKIPCDSLQFIWSQIFQSFAIIIGYFQYHGQLLKNIVLQHAILNFEYKRISNNILTSVRGKRFCLKIIFWFLTISRWLYQINRSKNFGALMLIRGYCIAIKCSMLSKRGFRSSFFFFFFFILFSNLKYHKSPSPSLLLLISQFNPWELFCRRACQKKRERERERKEMRIYRNRPEAS